MSKKEHFVVINEWSHEYESDVTILGVYHSLDEAKRVFNSCVEDKRSCAKKYGYTVFDDCDRYFDAGNVMEYEIEHTRVYIYRVKNK